MNQTVELDADTSVQLVEFIPDFVVQDGRVYARSKDITNPAVHMIVTSKKANTSVNVWLPEIPGIAENASSPYTFDPKDLKTGTLHRAAGLARTRPVGGVGGSRADGHRPDVCFLRRSYALLGCSRARCARPYACLWIGGTANRNRDAFELKFKNVVEQIQKELKPGTRGSAPVQATSHFRNNDRRKVSPATEERMAREKVEQHPATGTTLVVMVGLGIAFLLFIAFLNVVKSGNILSEANLLYASLVFYAGAGALYLGFGVTGTDAYVKYRLAHDMGWASGKHRGRGAPLV